MTAVPYLKTDCVPDHIFGDRSTARPGCEAPRIAGKGAT